MLLLRVVLRVVCGISKIAEGAERRCPARDVAVRQRWGRLLFPSVPISIALHCSSLPFSPVFAFSIASHTASLPSLTPLSPLKHVRQVCPTCSAVPSGLHRHAPRGPPRDARHGRRRHRLFLLGQVCQGLVSKQPLPSAPSLTVEPNDPADRRRSVSGPLYPRSPLPAPDQGCPKWQWQGRHTRRRRSECAESRCGRQGKGG